MPDIILIFPGYTPSGPLVFNYNPGPGSFGQYSNGILSDELLYFFFV